MMVWTYDARLSKFTGKERDSESGNDYFGARYYASTMGRWMSPDPINLTSARLLNPANTLNKYVYGANNPLKYLDKDGEDITIFYRPPNGSPTDFGHIMLGVLNQDTGRVGFLDYYPGAGGNSLGSGPGVFNPGNMGERGAQDAAGQFATLTIRTSPDEAQKVLDLIGKLKNGPTSDYSLLNNNCTTVCEDVLHDLGLDFGDISPLGYWADVYMRYSQYAQAHPYLARFSNIPQTTGREYGNPRNFGMNYTQLLFNIYMNQNQRDNSSVTTEQGPGTIDCVKNPNACR
jgi:RHS repeat-associated protein